MKISVSNLLCFYWGLFFSLFVRLVKLTACEKTLQKKKACCMLKIILSIVSNTHTHTHIACDIKFAQFLTTAKNKVRNKIRLNHSMHTAYASLYGTKILFSLPSEIPSDVWKILIDQINHFIVSLKKKYIQIMTIMEISEAKIYHSNALWFRIPDSAATRFHFKISAFLRDSGKYNSPRVDNCLVFVS